MTLTQDRYDALTRDRLADRTRRDGECHVWTGAVSSSGYGKLSYRGRVTDAHRVTWIVTFGPIDAGLVVAHRCDVRRCVNPDHLFLTTQAGNLNDMRVKGRESSGVAHGAAIRAGWTPELRARRAEQTRERNRRVREERAAAAGVSLDWKYCPCCSEWKPRASFYRNAARDDGLKPHCKPCSIQKDLARRRR